MTVATQVAQDAVAIRGILELLADPEPISSLEAANTQHISMRDADRLLHLLHRAGVIEHPTAERDVLGTAQIVPQIMLWQLAYAAMAGEVCTDAGILADGA